MGEGFQRLGFPDGDSLYARLSTRPIDQAPFVAADERLGTERLRSDVLAGGYRLGEPPSVPLAVIAAAGPLVAEAVTAAQLLADEEVPVVVLDVTSSDRLYRGWRDELRRAGRDARPAQPAHHVADLFRPEERRLPIVTVHDAASHHLAWLGSVFGAPTVPVGVDEFGQSGTIAALYEHFDLLPEQIANSVLVALAA